MSQLFFDEESIYEISKPYLKMDGQAHLQLFQSWGHNKTGESCFVCTLSLISLKSLTQFR